MVRFVYICVREHSKYLELYNGIRDQGQNQDIAATDLYFAPLLRNLATFTPKIQNFLLFKFDSTCCLLSKKSV